MARTIMTTTFITFGKDSYHLNGEMELWCRDIIGPGRWVGGQLETWEGMPEQDSWAICSMFGNTTFMFRRTQDYQWFTLRWAS
jgi:hypothetical protein